MYNPDHGEADSSSDDDVQEDAFYGGGIVEDAEREPPAKWPKHPGKKRMRRVNEWKRKKSSTLRNMGKEYTDRKGKKHNEKRMKAMNYHTCRFKCSENITEEQRQKYFDEY